MWMGALVTEEKSTEKLHPKLLMFFTSEKRENLCAVKMLNSHVDSQVSWSQSKAESLRCTIYHTRFG